MPELRIRLLGGFQVEYGDELLTGLQRSKLQALLAYLLLKRGEIVPRQQLAFLFWPDSTEKQARTNIRNLLYQLRQAVPNSNRYLGIDRASVQWLNDAPYVLDVAEFKEDIVKAENALSTGNQQAARSFFESAIDNYRGKLLPELYDDWILVAREQLHNTYVMVLEQMVQLDEDLRDYPRAIQTSKRLLQNDPLREASYRQLMRLYALNDERAAALHVYHTCVTTLARVLSVEPSPKTQRAYQRLLRLNEPSEYEPSHWSPMIGLIPLVGRQREWRNLTQVWEQARRGKPSIVLINGEAGIGKTRLAEEILDRTHRQGITALSTRSYEAEGDLAYAPITNWLRADALSSQLPKLGNIWLVEILRLLPELLEVRPDLVAPGPLTEQWQQQRFYEALVRAFLTGTQPILLHIDDLQWCDEETLSWLHFLLRYDRKARVLVVGSVRTEEITPEHALNAWIYALRRDDLLTEIELSPLQKEEMTVLAGYASGQELSNEFSAQLYRETEGNPLFLLEAIRAGWNGKDGKRDAADFEEIGTNEKDHTATIPERVKKLLERRLALLSPVARDVTGLASVIGREFSYPLLAAASNRDEDSLVRGLDELWQRRIVREQGTDTYDFSHDKLREVAYVNLSPIRRRYLHGRVAEAMEIQYADQLDEVGGELATHFEQAGVLDKACRYMRQAGSYASSRYASGEALTYLTRALSLTHKTDLETRYDILKEREQVYKMRAQRRNQNTDLKLMKELADAMDDNRRRAEVACLRANLAYKTGDVKVCVAHAEEASALARVANNQRLQAVSMLEWSRAKLYLDTLEVAEEGYRQAAQLAKAAGDAKLEAASLQGLSMTHIDWGDWDSCRDYDEQALRLYQEIGDLRGEATVVRHMAVVDALDGYPEVAKSKFEYALRLARQIGYVWLEAWIVTNLGWCALVVGELTQSLVHNDEALRLARVSGDRAVEVMILNDRCESLHQLGRYEEGLEAATQAVSIAQEIGNLAREANAWAYRGLMLADLERATESMDAFEKALKLYENQANDVGMIRAWSGLARASLLLHNVPRACSYVEKYLTDLDHSTRVISLADGGMGIHLTCYKILASAGDPQARQVLKQGYAFVMDRAERIPTPSLRQGFLENIVEAREIVREYQRVCQLAKAAEDL